MSPCGHCAKRSIWLKTMAMEGEWYFINDPASEKFQALESMAFMYLFRNREHLDFFYELKSISSVLYNQIKEFIDETYYE